MIVVALASLNAELRCAVREYMYVRICVCEHTVLCMTEHPSNDVKQYLRALQFTSVINEVDQGLDLGELFLFDSPLRRVSGWLPLILIADSSDLVHCFEFCWG